MSTLDRPVCLNCKELLDYEQRNCLYPSPTPGLHAVQYCGADPRWSYSCECGHEDYGDGEPPTLRDEMSLEAVAALEVEVAAAYERGRADELEDVIEHSVYEPDWRDSPLFDDYVASLRDGAHRHTITNPPSDDSAQQENEMIDDIDNWTTYHRPTPEAARRHEAVKAGAREFLRVIEASAPASADRTAAYRKVREAMMTASAAIACEPSLQAREGDR